MKWKYSRLDLSCGAQSANEIGIKELNSHSLLQNWVGFMALVRDHWSREKGACTLG